MQQDDEIDLAEIFKGLWARKVLIISLTFISVLISAVIALNLEKKFQATAIFELKDSRSPSSLGAGFGGLAALAGLPLGNLSSNSSKTFDRLGSRDFVLRLNRKIDLESDPYFVPLSQDQNSPVNKVKTLVISFVKKLVQKDEYQDVGNPNEDLKILDGIYATYLNSVEFSETEYGSIKIDVEHSDPNRASNIANAIVGQVKEELTNEDKNSDRDTLNYLATELAKAQKDLEEKKQTVRYFSLSNGLGPPAEFFQRSQKMAELREELKTIADTQLGIKAIRNLITQLKNPTPQDYSQVRTEFPIMDKLEFRRLLGISEALNSWTNPSISKLDNVSNVLEDRLARIRLNLSQMRVEAEKNAVLAEQLEGLQLQLGIATATYQVLQEQVKKFSLQSGFEAQKVKIYQTATPPLIASKPNRKLIVALGGVLGVFVGCAIALLINMKKGILFSQNSIAASLSSTFNVQGPTPSRFNGNISQFVRALQLQKAPKTIELDFHIRTNPQKPILVAPIGIGLNALPFALTLSSLNTHVETAIPRKTSAIILLEQNNSNDLVFDSTDKAEFKVAIFEDFTFYAPNDDTSTLNFITGPFFRNLMRGDYSQKHDRVIIVPSPASVPVTVSALVEYDPITVAITKPGRTTKQAVEEATHNMEWWFNVSLKN